MNKIIECVPNFSEGRDKEKIEKIVECFRGKDNVKLLDYSNDEDHNRLVVTVVGEPAPLRDAVIETHEQPDLRKRDIRQEFQGRLSVPLRYREMIRGAPQ